MLLSLTGVCANIGVSTVSDQESSVNGTAAATTSQSSDGWFLDQTSVIPHLELNLAAVYRFDSSKLMRSTNAADPNEDELIRDPVNLMATAKHPGFRLETETASGEPSNGFGLLSLVSGKYASWQASLAETRDLSDLNGVPVYPLVEIECGNWRLPVTLAIDPFRSLAK